MSDAAGQPGRAFFVRHLDAAAAGIQHVRVVTIFPLSSWSGSGCELSPQTARVNGLTTA